MNQAKAAQYLPAILVASFSWLAGGTLWYVCVTQSLCSTVSAETEPQASTQTTTQTTQTPVTTQTPAAVEQTTPDPAPSTPSFDKSQTVTVLFGPDSDEFSSDEWQDDLDEFITYLKANRTEKVTIAGYIAVGTPSQDSDSIEKKRALAVSAYMVENGVTQSQITTVARSGSVGDNSTRAGRIQNRRAVVSFDN